MAIFSRRILQRIINENARILSREQIARHVDALNKASEDSIPFEWEVVLINALTKLGNVVYEPNLGGQKRIDLHFSSNIEPGQSFIGDIATVTDKGYQAENPLKAFDNELRRIINKKKLNANHFSLDIGGETEGQFKKRKIKLKLPSKGKFKKIFNKTFYEFIENIVREPYLPKSFTTHTDNYDISISYNPMQKYFMCQHPSYTTAYSLTNNPIYNTLKRKTNQIKQTNYEGTIGIFLCDGGSNLLNSSGYAGLDYGANDIIWNFLRQNSSINFVLTFVVDRAQSWLSSMGIPYIKIELFRNYPTFESVGDRILCCLDELSQVLPRPINDVTNAINHLKSSRRKEGLSNYGGFEMTEKTAKISSRALLELLAGKVTQEKFLSDHNLTPTATHKDAVNFFNLRLGEGRMINDIRLEKSDTEDDDWIVIQFGDIDPSISSFVMQ